MGEICKQKSVQVFNQIYINPFTNTISNAKIFSHRIQSISHEAHFHFKDEKKRLSNLPKEFYQHSSTEPTNHTH